MDPLQGQQGPGDGNLYQYSNQQDDFSTPFNEGSTYNDPNTLFNHSFNAGFTGEYQPSSDASAEQSFQPSIGDPSQYGSYMPPQPDATGWVGGPYIDANQYGFNNVGQQGYPSNQYQPQRLAPYGTDVNMTFQYGDRGYDAPPQGQSSVTVSSVSLEHLSQTIPPSALQNRGEAWQESMDTSTAPAAKVKQDEQAQIKRAIPSPQPASVVQPPSGAQTLPLRPQYDQAEIGAGVPQGASEGGFHVRRASDYQNKAACTPLKGWIYLSNETFETNDSRLASLPEAPQRSSASQLRVRLESTDTPAGQADVKSRLEKKLARSQSIAGSRKKKKHKSSVVKMPSTPKDKPAANEPKDKAEESAESSDSSDSAMSSGSSSYDDASDVEEEPCPLPKAKPTDPIKAKEYEIIEAVWAPSHQKLTGDVVKTRVSSWLENLQQTRKAWKNSPDSKEGLEQKDLLEQMFRLTKQHGHLNFLGTLTQVDPLARLIAVTMTELVKADRGDDSLIEAIMDLFVGISNVKEPFIAASRLRKVAIRQSTKASGKVKEIAAKLVKQLNNSEENSDNSDKKSSEGLKAAMKVDSEANTTPSNGKIDNKTSTAKQIDPAATEAKSTTSAGSKKPGTLASDTRRSLPTSLLKNPVAATSGKVAPGTSAKTQPLVRTASSEGSSSKTATIATSTSQSKDKERTRHVVTKPPSIFSSISASKRPGAPSAATKPSVAAKTPASTQAPGPAKKEVRSVPVRASTGQVFSFTQTLASIGKTKEEEKPKKDEADNRPPETEEEKKKRLRKESRRHLRVSWPAEDQLCRIRLFDHGLEDEIAHEAAEVADLKDEGRAFKREYRQQHNKQIDFEQDYIRESDDVLDPENTDFSVIAVSQTNGNVVTRGGGLKPVESLEADEQLKREKDVMIAIYANAYELPYTPREPPPDPWVSNNTQQCEFGDPPIWIKNRSAAEMERMNGRLGVNSEQGNVTDILKNLSQLSQAPAPPAAPPQGNVDPNLQALLAQLAAPQQQQMAPPQPPPSQQPPPGFDPQAAINLFMSMQGNQNQAPMAPVAPPPQQQAPPPAAPDLGSILSSLANLSGQPQPAQQPPAFSQPLPQPPQNDVPPGIDPDIMAFLNKYNSNAAGQGAQQPLPSQQSQMQQAGFNMLGNFGQPAAGAQQTDPDTNERKRGPNDDAAAGGTKRRKYMGEPVVPCKYWKAGKCHYGDKCTFLHD